MTTEKLLPLPALQPGERNLWSALAEASMWAHEPDEPSTAKVYKVQIGEYFVGDPKPGQVEIITGTNNDRIEKIIMPIDRARKMTKEQAMYIFNGPQVVDYDNPGKFLEVSVYGPKEETFHNPPCWDVSFDIHKHKPPQHAVEFLWKLRQETPTRRLILGIDG